jgi:hypothetical protein
MSQYDGPPISDVYSPTLDDIRTWAYSDGRWPEQDWDIFMAEPENLELLAQLIEDPGCPTRATLLASLYCTVGHTVHTDSRIVAAVLRAAGSGDPWVSTWGRRVQHILNHPGTFDRQDWCGWESFASRPVDL